MRMTLEEFLMQYRRSLEQASELDDQIAEAEMIHRHLTATYEVEPVRGSRSNREAESPEILDLKAEKERILQDGRARRQEISEFIQSITADVQPLVLQREQRLLQLYYCDLLSWNEIKKLLRPLHMRKGKVVVNTGRARGISETQMFRLRQDALAHAERVYQRRMLG